ncbi:MAG: biotin--[acetyl-CoA-carboxylase] ligase [Nitrospira sp.]|nr:biotin--[acetyl-CoA-carboxylase] ligase [Nitrospira sp.]MCP9441029.1 biotin--[acetyl-CoA-carboxylase] ligase [Nitrospira sp.]
MIVSSPLILDDIRSTLGTVRFGQRLYVHHEIPSTNSEAMALAQAGAEHGTVVIADSQTAGRGRLTRQWYSPPGVNLYCSVIVKDLGRTGDLAEWLAWMPLASALAVAEAVQAVAGIHLSLKWPNDLVHHGRKVGGILCESLSVSLPESIVIIGIGLNVNLPQEIFPDDLRQTATSLFAISHQPVDRNRLLAQLLYELEQSVEELSIHGPSRLRQAYVMRCKTLGQRVRAMLGADQEVVGTAESIAPDGALQVRPSLPVPGRPTPGLIDIHAADVIHLRE